MFPVWISCTHDATKIHRFYFKMHKTIAQNSGTKITVKLINNDVAGTCLCSPCVCVCTRYIDIEFHYEKGKDARSACVHVCMCRHLVVYIFPTVANMATNHPIQEAVNYKHTHMHEHNMHIHGHRRAQSDTN